MISIVIPNFNSADRLVKNLPILTDLLKKAKLDHEIIVSDDASTDDSRAILERYIANSTKTSDRTNLLCLFKDKNTGFGMTVDAGIKKAQGEIVFILNAIDLLPESADFFKQVLKHFEDQESHGPERSRRVFSVAAVKKDETGEHGKGVLVFSRGLFMHFKQKSDFEAWQKSSSRLLNGYIAKLFERKTDNNLTVQQFDNSFTDWADGGAQALRKKYYLEIGGFDPAFRFYWEDVDLGFRAWQAGYKVIYEPQAVLLHTKSEGPIAKKYTSSQLRRMNLYGQFIFTWKNSDFRHLFLHFLWQPYHLAVAAKNHDADWFVAMFQALLYVIWR
jgi:GT2 family glycosyltransferase